MGKFRPDFHLHTVYSDGTSSPEELLEGLHKSGVTHFSVTDHDSLAVQKMIAEGPALDMKIFVGVEINTSDSDEALHILGYGSGLLKSKYFEKKIAHYRQARERRACAILERLNAHGIPLTLDQVQKNSKEAIGRPNIADALVAMGVVGHRKEAFQRFLLPGKPAYAPPEGPGPQEAIESITEAGGVAVLAHPGVASIDSKKLSSLVDWGLRGIEAYHPMHSKAQTQEFLREAKNRDLFTTCGSDYHGPRSGREELLDYGLEPNDLKSFFEVLS